MERVPRKYVHRKITFAKVPLKEFPRKIALKKFPKQSSL
jgi:hypothetical protein